MLEINTLWDRDEHLRRVAWRASGSASCGILERKHVGLQERTSYVVEINTLVCKNEHLSDVGRRERGNAWGDLAHERKRMVEIAKRKHIGLQE